MTQYIWHYWADWYEPVEITNETPTRVQFANGLWSTKETKFHIIAQTISELESKRQDRAQKNLIACRQRLEEAQVRWENVVNNPLKKKESTI